MSVSAEQRSEGFAEGEEIAHLIEIAHLGKILDWMF